MNKYKLYANLVFTWHTFVVLFELACLPLVFIFPAWRLLPALFVTLTMMQWWVLRDRCYLTTLENHLRAKYDKSLIYRKGCVAHYLGSWLGLRLTNFQVDVFFYIYFTLIIYFAIFSK